MSKCHFIITRLKNMPLGDREGVDAEALLSKLGKYSNKDLSYWDFLSTSFEIDEEVKIEDLMDCLLFEKSLSGGASATEMKILHYFKEKMTENGTTTLENLLNNKSVDVDQFSKEL